MNTVTISAAVRVAFCFLLATAGSALADSETGPKPLVICSAWGPCFFTMRPTLKDGNGVAYGMQDDGNFRVLWRVNGWYSTSLFLSQDGRYLVRLERHPDGQGPTKKDLAVAFYDRGKELARYSTADLVKDKGKAVATTSHYQWLADSVFVEHRDGVESGSEPHPCIRDWDFTFALKTADSIIYQFDLRTGKILRPIP